MTHFGKCLYHCSLEQGFFEDSNAQREGGPWKGAPESPLGVGDCFIDRRQLECLKLNRIFYFANYNARILGVYVKRNCPTFGQVRASKTSRRNR